MDCVSVFVFSGSQSQSGPFFTTRTVSHALHSILSMLLATKQAKQFLTSMQGVSCSVISIRKKTASLSVSLS